VRGRAISSERSNKPYRLHGIMLRHNIRHADLYKRLKFVGGVRAGRCMAPTTFSVLLIRHIWPLAIPRETIIAQTAEVLRERGVPEDEIASAFEIEGGGSDEPLYYDANIPMQPGAKRERTTSTQPQDPPFPFPEAEMLSPAAREHFKLARHPFMDDVQGPHDVYIAKDQRYVRESMFYAAKHSGIIAVIGESGAGKSTLRRDLIDRIVRDSERIAIIQPKTIDKKVLTAAHICDAIIADLSTEAPKQSLEAKARQVERVLRSSAHGGNLHAVIIEEAHDLTNATIKYLKRFWELEDGFRKLLGIVLIGQPELRDRLDERKNPDVREFIRRCEIATLNSLNGNLEEYLAFKFKRVGIGLDAIFEKDAFDAIRTRLTRRSMDGKVESHLYPLIVHNVCVKAMNQAVELGLPKVSAKLVEKV